MTENNIKGISAGWTQRFLVKFSLLLALMLPVSFGYTKSIENPVTPRYSVVNDLSKSMPKDLKNMNPHVLRMALKAFEKAKAMGLADKSLLTIVDYTLPSTQKRFWVVDLNQKKVIYHTFVAHGKGSGAHYPKRFGDNPGSHQSVVGVFITGDVYQGRHGVSLKLHGLEKGINDKALSRKIVVHGANYVNEAMIQRTGQIGLSWGCFALDSKLAHPVIHTIKDGSMVFAYYPDDKWLKQSKYL